MAYQTVTPARMGQQAVTTSVVVAYTVPALTRAMLKSASVANTTAAPILLNMFIVPSGGSAGTANALMYGATVPANGVLQWDGLIVMDAGATIEVQGSAVGLTFIASGGEAT